MGTVVSTAASREKKSLNRRAEKLLAEAKASKVKEFKILLLGTGESGKSTIVKQMRILHKNGFTQNELAHHRSTVAWNVLNSICTIIRAMEILGISFERAEREGDAANVLIAEKEWVQNGRLLNSENWTQTKRLWADGGVRACFARSHEYQLCDSTKYFCDDMDRISCNDYTPNEQDMLRLRVTTEGIVEIDFNIRSVIVKIIDVGGQRSQRRKWIHCFEYVNALIFICAVSEYNQVLLEDHHVNRLQESLKLFGTIINSQWFRKADILLFLNKKDVFEEKIKLHPLTTAFPEYSGGSSYEEALTFIQSLFDRQNENPTKTIYPHHTCATDTRNVEFVMNAALDIIISKNMAEAGLY